MTDLEAAWAAVLGRTELECVEVMARCLGELREGRWAEKRRRQPRRRDREPVSSGSP